MSRLFSFFLSAAIIILCLWLNVNSYPNILRYEDVQTADETAAVSTDGSEQSQVTDEQDANNAQEESLKTEENSNKDSSSDVNSEPSKETQEPISASVEENLLNVSVASNQKFSSSERASNSSFVETPTKVKTSAEKPQGGKYVSIPSVEVDAFRSRFGSDSGRVIGVSRASVVAE